MANKKKTPTKGPPKLVSPSYVSISSSSAAPPPPNPKSIFVPPPLIPPSPHDEEVSSEKTLVRDQVVSAPVSSQELNLVSASLPVLPAKISLDSAAPSLPCSVNLSLAELVSGTGAKMKKNGSPFKLDSGELCVKIPSEVISRKQKSLQETFIIGQFHGNAPPPKVMHTIVNGIWSRKSHDIMVSKLMDQAYLICIPSPLTRRRIFEQGMWHVEKETMFVAKWVSGLNPSLPVLTYVPVWLEFHGVPPHLFSKEGLEHIARMVGKPLHMHPTTASMTNIAVSRVYIIVDPTQSLPEAVNIQLESRECWLPPRCEFCHEIGHSKKR